jgi:sugar lactone lactonase YvrE
MPRTDVLVDGLDHPEGVAWDPASGILWAGGETGQLYRVDVVARTWSETARAPEFVLGLAVDGRGRLAVGSAEALDPDGALDVFSESLPHFPNGCVVSPDGRYLGMVESTCGRATTSTSTSKWRSLRWR